MDCRHRQWHRLRIAWAFMAKLRAQWITSFRERPIEELKEYKQYRGISRATDWSTLRRCRRPCLIQIWRLPNDRRLLSILSQRMFGFAVAIEVDRRSRS
jgi:hypothetical protein